MRKISLLLALVFSISYSVTAQQYDYGPEEEVKGSISLEKVRFGVYFAPTSSWMKPTASKSDDGQYLVSNQGSKIGYCWGLMADYFFAPNYGISTGFQINTTGGKILAEYNTENPDPNAISFVRSADFDYRLQYVEVPFALKLMSDNLKGGVRVFGQVGLTAGINISKKATYTVVYSDTSSTSTTGRVDKTVTGENEKIKGGLAISPLLLQLNLGGGVEYQLTNKLSFYAGLFFNNGFVPDATNPKEINLGYKGNFTDANTRLNNIALRLGLFF